MKLFSIHINFVRHAVASLLCIVFFVIHTRPSLWIFAMIGFASMLLLHYIFGHSHFRIFARTMPPSPPFWFVTGHFGHSTMFSFLTCGLLHYDTNCILSILETDAHANHLLSYTSLARLINPIVGLLRTRSLWAGPAPVGVKLNTCKRNTKQETRIQGIRQYEHIILCIHVILTVYKKQTLKRVSEFFEKALSYISTYLCIQ